MIGLHARRSASEDRLATAANATRGPFQNCARTALKLPGDVADGDLSDSESVSDSDGLYGWAMQDLNLRRPPCEEGTLPLS